MNDEEISFLHVVELLLSNSIIETVFIGRTESKTVAEGGFKQRMHQAQSRPRLLRGRWRYACRTSGMATTAAFRCGVGPPRHALGVEVAVAIAIAIAIVVQRCAFFC